ncbi:MAG: YidH family protein [Microcystaceae cyanobacterium]
MMTEPSRPTNINTELAKERNRAAAERTLMAWIRTCLALISFGFGIDRIVAAINRNFQGTINNSIHLSRILGLSFIAVGTIAMLLAAIEHKTELNRIEKKDYHYRPRVSIGLSVSISLIIIGAIAFLGVLIQSSG